MPVIRSILVAVQMFSSIDALITFIEETIANRYDLNSKSETFEKKIAFTTNLYYKMMMDKPEIGEIFKTKKHQRFLMHLIAQNILILDTFTCGKRYLGISPTESITFEIQMAVLRTAFKYSCAPNMIYILDNGKTAGIVVCPINEGEEITANHFSWMPDNDWGRRQFLLQEFGAPCKCSLSASVVPATIRENPILHYDSDFFIIKTNNRRHRNQYSDEEAEKLKETCELLLMKYGRMQSCKEIETVVQVYELLLAHCDITKHSPFYQKYYGVDPLSQFTVV